MNKCVLTFDQFGNQNDDGLELYNQKALMIEKVTNIRHKKILSKTHKIVQMFVELFKDMYRDMVVFNQLQSFYWRDFDNEASFLDRLKQLYKQIITMSALPKLEDVLI